jgi:predicted  nucleic acid-binding Zn-ribbon protein
MTLEQRLSEKDRENKELKRVLARELQSLHSWAEGHLAVKDVKFEMDSSEDEGDDKPLNIETVKNPLGSKIKKAISDYRSLLKRIALANAQRVIKMKERADLLESEVKKVHKIKEDIVSDFQQVKGGLSKTEFEMTELNLANEELRGQLASLKDQLNA